MKPFPFEKIPKIDAREEEMKILLRKFRAGSDFFSSLRRVIQETLSRELSQDFSCRLEKPSWASLNEKIRALAPQGIYLTFSLSPSPEKAVLEIDPLIAHAAVDKLLGGAGEFPVSMRPLTEIEEGVLTFLFLKIFAGVFEAKSLQSEEGAPLHFRMQGLVFSQDELAPAVSFSEEDSEDALQIPLKLSFRGRSGYARLLLPRIMAESMAANVSDGVEASEAPEISDTAKLARLGFIKTSLWSELGRVPLKVADINALEVGDVVVLEDTGAHVQSGRLAGHLSLRVGQGECGSFFAEIVPDHASLKVKILRAEREIL